MRFTRTRRLVASLALIAALGMALAMPQTARAGGGTGMTNIVTTGAAGSYASLPMAVPAGLTSITLNAADDNTSVNVARLNAGVTQAQVRAAMKQGIGPVLSLVTLIGGADGVPHSNRRAILNMTTGTYVVFNLDLLTSDKPHSPVAFITAGPDMGVTAPPTAQAAAHLHDMKIDQPASIPAGMDTIRIYNTGPSPHEYVVGKMHPGTTVKQVLAYVLANNPSGPPPVDFLAGAGVMSPNTTQWMVQQFTPGRYIALCFIPDFVAYPGHKPTNKPHAALGMYTAFTVY